MDRPNVFLIVLDSLRQRTFQELLEAGELPTLSKIADSGQRFTSASSNAAWTLPSHSSIFTGTRVSHHETHAGSATLDVAAEPLAERLSNHGYTTMGISGNTWVSPEFGFDRGFDTLSMKWDYCWNGADLSTVSETDGIAAKLRTLLGRLELSNAPQTLVNSLYGQLIDGRYDMGGRNTTRRTCKWLKNHGSTSQPFFFFINYLEPHLPYEPPAEYLDRFLPDVPQARIDSINQDPWEYISGESSVSSEEFEILEGLYKAETVYVDALLGKIHSKLSEVGLLEDTCFVIAGDHGDNIGDHGLMDHQYSLHETLLNVPLLVQYPDRRHSGTVVDDSVELRDIFPTILEMADIERPSAPGVSTNDLGRSPGRDYVIGEYRYPQPAMDSIEQTLGYLPETMTQYDRALRSIRSDGWKLIEGSDGSTALYDLDSDPWERNDVSTDFPDRVERLSDRLDEEGIPTTVYTAQDSETDGMNEASKERLESLGYI